MFDTSRVQRRQAPSAALVIGEPIKRTTELTGEADKWMGNMGTSQSAARTEERQCERHVQDPREDQHRRPVQTAADDVSAFRPFTWHRATARLPALRIPLHTALAPTETLFETETRVTRHTP